MKRSIQDVTRQDPCPRDPGRRIGPATESGRPGPMQPTIGCDHIHVKGFEWVERLLLSFSDWKRRKAGGPFSFDYAGFRPFRALPGDQSLKKSFLLQAGLRCSPSFGCDHILRWGENRIHEAVQWVRNRERCWRATPALRLKGGRGRPGPYNGTCNSDTNGASQN